MKFDKMEFKVMEFAVWNSCIRMSFNDGGFVKSLDYEDNTNDLNVLLSINVLFLRSAMLLMLTIVDFPMSLSMDGIYHFPHTNGK